MSRPDQIEIERLRYWQGQKLRSRDFSDQMAIEAELRWWHNRALHNAFGVRYGLTVSLNGKLDAVIVDCGVAYDCFGRELILQTRREIPLPDPGSTPNSMTLLIRYKEIFDKQVVSGACAPRGCAPLLEHPEFMWKPSACVKVSDGVPLAQLSYDNSKGGFELDPGLTAPALRPLARPRIGSGATVPGGTAWELWSEWVRRNEKVVEVAVGYQVIVDTTAAGFTETPCYFAWLEGTLWDRSNIEFFPVPLTHIDLASPTKFRFRLWSPFDARVLESNSQFESAFINFARRRRLYVCWLGIQPSLAEIAMAKCISAAVPECFNLKKDRL